MISFLRKLRRNEMKNTNYIKYALSEIILVVIGILIALGINTWNEQRKKNDAEVSLLEKVKAENEYNLSMLYDDSTYMSSIEENIIELALALRETASEKKDSIVGLRLNDALRVSTTAFSSEYLGRYINSSEISDKQLVYEFIELKDLFNSYAQADELMVSYKFDNILTYLENGIDYLEGEISDMQVLENKVFINRLILLSSIEESRSSLYERCLDKAIQVDSLIALTLKQ